MFDVSVYDMTIITYIQVAIGAIHKSRLHTWGRGLRFCNKHEHRGKGGSGEA